MTTMQEPETTPASRREFLKTSAVAGAAVAANLSLLSNAHADGTDTIKVGLVGCGGRGSDAVFNALNAAPNVQVVAIGDVFKFRVERLRNELAKVAQNGELKKRGNTVDLPEERCFVGLDCYEKVIHSPANYIILATPPGFRPMCLQAAVTAGKNIFTEKPVGVDGPGIRKVLNAYAESVAKNLAIGAGTQRRHQNAYLEAMKRIHDGAIGEIKELRAYWNGGGIWFRKRNELAAHHEKDTDLAYQLHNWYHFVWTCGDHIVEQHVHNLDVCNWAMGNKHPVRVMGVGSRAARQVGDPNVVGHIYDQFALEYEYENGTRMISMCRQVAGTDGNFPSLSGVSEAAVGTKGHCYTADHSRYFIKGETQWTFDRANDNSPYVQEHTDLIHSIRTGKPINELKNVAESTLTAIMGRMAAYTGKVVTWDKALNSKQDTMAEAIGHSDRLTSWDVAVKTPPVAVPGRTALV
jgi:predicted dehydrogenase